MLRQIVAQASDLLAADACTLRLLEGGELVARAVLGEASELLSVRRSLAADPIAAETLAGPAPVAIADLAADPRVADEPIVRDAGLAAYLGVPVQTADGEIQGVLAVYARTPRRFRADEVDGLAALAGSAAVALRNALLYERVAQEKDAGEAILAQVADAIVASDADDRITRWNAAAERVTGLRARRVLGRELGELLRSELGDTDGTARAALEAASAGSSSPMEIRLERGGREIWLSITGASLRDPREERPGTVFAIRDVSDERRLDQVKSDFVATVSHELRTPLTSIYGFAETLLRADTTFGDDDRATFVRYIATEAERLTRLVDGLLSATRLEAGAVQLALGPVDVPALAREVATAARGRSDRHRVKLVVPAAPGVRAGRSGSRPAGADQPRRQRDQVLAGGRRGEGAGAGTGQARRGARVRPGHRHLRARSAQPLPQVLPRGRLAARRHPRRRPRPVPRAWVRRGDGRAHLGRVRARQGVDVRRRAAGLRGGALGHRRRRACRIAAAPLHILVVDDEPAIRMLCRVNLQADGMTVDEAWDSGSAIEAARARRPDAVLLDVMLPGDDGFAVAASLREVPGMEAVPIMLLTARADLDGSELVRRSGAAAVLTKPFNPVDLSERLRALARP